MIWGCFSGSRKGPCLFWEKEWGTINHESYCEKIVPLIHGWIRLYPEHQLMQDGGLLDIVLLILGESLKSEELRSFLGQRTLQIYHKVSLSQIQDSEILSFLS